MTYEEGIQPIQTTKSYVLPPSLYDATAVATQTDREGITYTIMLGLDEDLVAQLRAYSLDANDIALSVTSDRARFGEGSYEAWYAKDRTPFALVDTATKELAALVWYGPKPIGQKPTDHSTQVDHPDAHWVTASYRSYGKFRGKGLMKPFVRFTLDMYRHQTPEARLWLGVSTDNEPSLRLAQSLGFRIDDEWSDQKQGWLVLTQVRDAIHG